MFCPSNDTLSTITEKTKLLAQKCTQQIRVQHQQSCLSPGKKSNNNHNNTSILTTLSATVFNSKESLLNNKDDGGVSPSSEHQNNVKSNFKCFCPCKGSLSLRALTKRGFSKDTNTTSDGGSGSTTRWYVKV